MDHYHWENSASIESWYGKLTGHFGESSAVSAFYLKNVQGLDGNSVDPDIKEHMSTPGVPVRPSIWGFRPEY